MPHTKIAPIKADDEITNASPTLHSPQLFKRNGPVTERTWSDRLYCFIFILWVIGIFGVFSYIIFGGNMAYVGNAYDSDGKRCGIDPGYENYPYLYYPRPTLKYRTHTVCVKSCPVAPLPIALDCKKNSIFSNCVITSTDFTSLTPDMLLPTTFYGYSTLLFANQLCVPQEPGTKLKPLSNSLVDLDIVGQWVGDLNKTWLVVLKGVIISAGVGLIYVFFMCLRADVLLFVAATLGIASVGVSAGMLIGLDDPYLAIANTTDKIADKSIISKNILGKELTTYFLIGVGFLYYMSVLFVFAKVKLASKVMKSVNQYVSQTTNIFIFAIVIAVILGLFFGVWIVAVRALMGFGITYDIKATPFGTSIFEREARYFLIFAIVTFFWITRILMGCVEFVVASSACIWYFSQRPGQTSVEGTVGISIKRLIRYHFGAVVIGSLVMTVLAPLRPLFFFIGPDPFKKSKKCSCLMPIKRMLAIIDSIAYAQVAMTGKSFYEAAKDAYSLALRNPVRMKMLRNIGGIFSFYFKGSATFLATMSALLIVTFLDDYKAKIYSPLVTIFLVFLLSYPVASVFLSIYGMASDALLMCFVIEEELYLTTDINFRHCPKLLKMTMLKEKRIDRIEQTGNDEEQTRVNIPDDPQARPQSSQSRKSQQHLLSSSLQQSQLQQEQEEKNEQQGYEQREQGQQQQEEKQEHHEQLLQPQSESPLKSRRIQEEPRQQEEINEQLLQSQSPSPIKSRRLQEIRLKREQEAKREQQEQIEQVEQLDQ